MSDSVQEAASLFRAWQNGERNMDRDYVLSAIETLAEAYLAEHPADDGEPVTEEWLMSIGGWKHGDDIALTKDIGYDCHYVGISTSNCIGWQAINSFDDQASIGGFETRGQVRMLCRALGITLKEQACGSA